MTQNKRAIVFIVGGLLLYLLLIAAVSAASFANAGGTANVFSHSNDVQIEADSIGDVTTIAGNRNAMQYQPESDQHKSGERLMLGGWVLLLAALGWGLFKAMGYQVVMYREKST